MSIVFIFKLIQVFVMQNNKKLHFFNMLIDHINRNNENFEKKSAKNKSYM